MFSLYLNAQVVIEESFKVAGETRTGYVATSAKYDRSRIDSAIAGKLAKGGLYHKGRTKGYQTFVGQSWSATGPGIVTVNYKVTGKKGKVRIYFAVSKGLHNDVTAENDPKSARNIQFFLTTLDAGIAKDEQLAKEQAANPPVKQDTDSSKNIRPNQPQRFQKVVTY